MPSTNKRRVLWRLSFNHRGSGSNSFACALAPVVVLKCAAIEDQCDVSFGGEFWDVHAQNFYPLLRKQFERSAET